MDDIAAQHKNWFKGLDSLRFILALIVLMSHFQSPYVFPLMASASTSIKWFGYIVDKLFDGSAAVIAFFIISGFVIHYPNKNGIKDLKTFWIRRFVRIFVPLIIIYFVGIKFNHPDRTVVWSLICELFYYAVYPLLAKIKLSWLYKFIIAYVVAAILIIWRAHPDVISLFGPRDIKYHGYYWQLGIFLTWIVGLPVWLLGVLLAEHIDKLGPVSFTKLLLYRIVIILLSCFFSSAQAYMHVSFILTLNIFALLIYKWLQAEIIYFKTREPNALLEKMGKFSYSLYLCHPTIYVIMGFWLSNTFINYPIFIIVSIAVSYLFYLAVEKPSHLLAIKLAKSVAKK